MARANKTFGPLLYGTLLLGAVVALFAGVLRFLEWRSAIAEAETFDVAADIAALLPMVAAGDPEGRVRAIQALAETRDRYGPSDAQGSALTALRQALRDGDVSVRAAAAEALGAFGSMARSAADELIGLLEDDDPDVRIAAAGALLRIGGEGGDSALRLLSDMAGDPEAIVDRGAVVEALLLAGEPGQDAAARALAGLLADEDAAVRAEAVRCAPALGAAVTRLTPLVMPLLDSADPDVRYGAAMVMIRGLDPAAEPDPRLVAILEQAARDPSLTLGRREDALASLYSPGTAGGAGMGGGMAMPGGMAIGFGPAGFSAGSPRPSALRRCGLELARQLAHEDADVRFAAAVLLQMIDPETLSGKNEEPGSGGP